MMPKNAATRRSSFDGRPHTSRRKMHLGRQMSDPAILKSGRFVTDNGRNAATDKIDRISFLEIEEEFDNVHRENLRSSLGSFSGRSLTDVDLQVSERMKKKEMVQKERSRRERSQKKLGKLPSLINFQNPQYNDGEQILNGRHNSGSNKLTDDNQTDSENHHRQCSSPKKGSQYSSQCDDSFDLVPTDLYVSRREGKFWLTIYLCIILSLSAILAVIIVSVNRGNNSPSVRGTIAPPVINNTDSSSPLYVRISPEEKDLLDSSHNVVKACIEKETDTPKTCQEYCESKKCCFEEFNCETLLTGDECLSYIACRSWLTESTNSSATDTNDR